MTDYILVEDANGVRTITMNRPEKRNALTVAMYDRMAEALTEAGEGAARAVLFRGAGGFFTGGNDIMDFVANPPTGDDSAVFRFLFALVEAPIPLVAEVEGLAVGIGTTMLLHCDLVYAAPDARFHLPFVDLGLVPEAASSILLPRRIGHARAARMLLLGEPLEAAEAAEAGLVTGIVPAEELGEAALAKATALAAKPANALRTAKSLMKPNKAEILETMRHEGELFGKALRSPEAMAAFQAFLGKGKKG
ncbi:enoyl-CoA hydratase-related protein [Indioceanicola profundi]|uniref:enoyl-CoA hydratase-related protein n=1 Tax=Indioceanicola profundi TaxID=2220096 RepID=UPI000E6A9A5D|nr:enoyl-CoA hydratase-related protein [Indioceanicola profundi]